MEHHQRGNHGNGLIIAQMTDLFQMPKDFNSWIYLSNILQAEGIRYGVEHWRRNMHRVAGTLYWQLNDCWPVASWASIDYFGRWKALHYAAKKFYAPLLLSIEDNPPHMDVHVSNDLVEAVQVTIIWSLEEPNGKILDSGKIESSAEALSNTKIQHFDFSSIVSKQNQRNLVFMCELWQDATLVTTSVATFVPSKHLLLENPQLTITHQIEGSDIVINLTSKRLARFVKVNLKGYDLVYSDNYFDIPSGRTKTIRCKVPEGLKLDEFNEYLKIFTLFDSYSD
jgi:beta-mannosidase